MKKEDIQYVIRKYLIFLGLLLIIFMAGVFVENSIADMFKWVDENGVVHFSDAPPDDADNSDIEKDKAAARRKAQIDRQTGVPFAIINGKGINGYNEKAYNDALR